MFADAPLASVVIPTFRREELLRETLADVLAQDYPHCEVIVVDQTEVPVRVGDARVSVIHTRPPHLTRARNVGARASRGAIVVFVDDDVALPRHFISAHVSPYEDERVGAVAGRVIRDPNPRRPLSAPPPPTGVDLDRAQPGRVPFARGCNMSFRRAALFDAGLFDEQFSAAGYGEEEDVCFALRRRGFLIVFAPQAWLIHRQAPRGGIRAEQHNAADRAAFYRDKTYFALKNLGGLDFCRVLWDTYRHALPPRARGMQMLSRPVTWARGSLAGLAHFLAHGTRRRPLPYRAE